ncbi:tetratricopeptide repeat protein [Croceimicrobium sp.]|uniref:tetratricopeptide repeat protein n=1 Tax=Croceimicrobium sp. TaxID=2828340 RepID=UPI003BA8904F
MLPELHKMEQRLDSLKGEERFSFLMELAQAYAQVDVPQSRGFLQEAVVLSKNLNRHDFTARALNGMGITYFIQGDLNSALDYYQQSLGINEFNNDSSGLAVNYSNLSNIYVELGEFNKATNYFYKGLQLARLQGDSATMADINNNLARLYSNLGDQEKAVSHLRSSLELYRKIGEEDVLTDYNNLGISYEKMGQPDSALYFYKACIKLADQAHQKPSRFYALSNMVSYFLKIDAIDSARFYLDQALNDPQLKEYDNFYLTFGIRDVRVLAREGKVDEALDKGLFFMEMARNYSRLQDMVDLASSLHQLYALKGDYKTAYSYLLEHSMFNDSLLSQSNIAELAKLEERYQYQIERERIESNHQAEIRDQELKRFWVYWFLGGLGILTVAFAWNAYTRRARNIVLREKNQRIEKQHREIQEQEAELRDQKQSLEMLNAFKDRILAVMAHDLKSPLNSLQGLIDLSNMEEGQDPQIIIGFMRKLSSEVVILRQSIENLLHWARLQIGIAENNKKERIAVATALTQVIDLFTGLAKNKNIEIVQDLKEGDLQLKADAEIVRIVLRNFISNALKFNPEGSSIFITGERKEQCYCFRVRDQGPGLRDSQREEMFSEMMNPSVGTAKEMGTGLGLFLCSEFVRANGGKIGVESEAGEGSTFWFSLPIFEA